jgi:hypothetical protein
MGSLGYFSPVIKYFIILKKLLWVNKDERVESSDEKCLGNKRVSTVC